MKVLIRDQDLVMIGCVQDFVMPGFEKAPQASETQPSVLKRLGDRGLFVRALCQAASGADLLCMYISGHGMTITGSVSPGFNRDSSFLYPHLL